MTFPAEVSRKLSQYQQQHLCRFWEQLKETERHELLRQLETIDFEQIQQLTTQAQATSRSASAVSMSAARTEGEQKTRIQPLDQKAVFRLLSDDSSQQQLTNAKNVGNGLLDQGKVGAILVAGGQGSRLGFPHPKGMFPIGPVTDRSLFQIFFEQLLALSNRHSVRIPYFIMTSDATHEETEQFLTEHAWFGYPAEDVYLFRQGTMPAVDDQRGEILLAGPAQIAMSPDGHGGLLPALRQAGLIHEMARRGIEYLYYHQVDNPCARLCDPVMLGLHAVNEVEISTKVVAKRDAGERVGVLAEIDGKQGIVEYSDLPRELAESRDEQGRLLFWAGNIAIHVFSYSLLQRLSLQDNGLPIHIAHKRVDYIDGQGHEQKPETPNAFKFERFIFDAIPLASSALVIETSREEEFQPVKNATGADSPESSRKALQERSQRWLKQAGYELQADISIEISPLIALDEDDLTEELIAEIRKAPVVEHELVLVPELLP